MKEYLYPVIAVLFLAGVTGCGDNKTKEKLLGTSVISSSSGGGGVSTGSGGNTAQASTPQGSSASMMANSASMATMAGKGGAVGLPAPYYKGMLSQAFSSNRAESGLIGPDAEGYFTEPGMTGSTMKIRFQKADGTAITNYQSAEMASLAKVRIKLTSAYSFGTFTGDFLMKVDFNDTTQEVMETGTIVLSNDPAGLGGFTATITNMAVEMVGSGSTRIGIPKQGSMTITSTNGSYTGTGTYSKSGADFVYTGDINAVVNGVSTKVAEVHLTHETTFGNYSGYWLDTVANDGVRHEISADVAVK